MKCKSWSNKINNFVARRLKSIKTNRQPQNQQQQQQQQQQQVVTTETTCSTMPAMPKEKTATAVSLNENNFSELKYKELATTVSATATDVGGGGASMAHTVITTSGATMLPSTSFSSTSPTTTTSSAAAAAAVNAATHQQQQRCGCGNAAATTAATLAPSSSSSSSSTATDSTRCHIRLQARNGHTSPSPLTEAASHQQQQQQQRHSQNSTSNVGRSTPIGADAATVAAAATITPPARRSANDYVFGRYIGEGSFSSVYLAQDIYNKRDYAIKVCDKRHILREHKQEYVRREREIMHSMTNVPGFVNLSCTFQDARSLFFVMTFAQNGDLLPHINKVGSFDVECTRHYAAEIVLACEQMHRRNIVHRDLKPENILLDEDMHTLIADFGSAKILTPEDRAAAATMLAKAAAAKSSNTFSTSTTSLSPTTSAATTNGSSSSNERQSRTQQRFASNNNINSNNTNNNNNTDDDSDEPCDEDCASGASNEDAESPSRQPRYQRNKRRGSFVGTAQYVSPEVLQNQPITPAADLWALGCIIYQMISGLPPFRGSNDFVIFKEILACDLDFPAGFDKDAEDLVRKLLKVDPEERLGALDDFTDGCYNSLRAHTFFADINFDRLRENTPPKIYPYLPVDELRSKYKVPDNLEPGLDERQLTRLLGMEFGTALSCEIPIVDEADEEQKSEYDLSSMERLERLEQQKSDKWNNFADNEVIFKKGFVNKRKGLFARKRMLLLTSGPRLIYIDPVQMIKKGEIPWTPQLRVEPKNFKIFFVHTPNRTYYLEDSDGYALEWVDAIERMRLYAYKDIIAATTTTTAGAASTTHTTTTSSSKVAFSTALTTPTSYAKISSSSSTPSSTAALAAVARSSHANSSSSSASAPSTASFRLAAQPALVTTTATSYVHVTRPPTTSTSSRQSSKILSS